MFYFKYWKVLILFLKWNKILIISFCKDLGLMKIKIKNVMVLVVFKNFFYFI